MILTDRQFATKPISVPNVEKAVEFYSAVMGCYQIMEPTDVVEDDSVLGVMCTDIFGAEREA